ncbi:MAG: putative intracellular septation protein A [Minwuia thermotolerans]|nr:MAG: putative intracellular septation protein A [Minwuia thermotolerans]
MAERTRISPFTKFLIEVGPLGVFFFANNRFDIFTATAAFMVAVTVSLAANYALERRLPAMPLVTGVFVLVMGGLTLYLQDDLFIKIKPTITNLLFAGILLGGLAWGKLFLRYVFGAAFRLEDAGWRILTIRWSLFFVFLAIVNEIVWRNFDTDTWVNFKVFGIMPMTFIFALAQLPVVKRHGSIVGAEEDDQDNRPATGADTRDSDRSA